MTDPTPTPPAQQSSQAGLQIPAEVQQKFGDLIALVKASESMNDEERQYWINILPIMTPEQIGNLRDILENERKQLAAIDTKYQTEIEKLGEAEVIRQTEEERRARRLQRVGSEASHKEREEEKTEDLLKQIENAGGNQTAAPRTGQ